MNNWGIFGLGFISLPISVISVWLLNELINKIIEVWGINKCVSRLSDEINSLHKRILELENWRVDERIKSKENK